jgi:hypothetical protein
MAYTILVYEVGGAGVGNPKKHPHCDITWQCLYDDEETVVQD